MSRALPCHWFSRSHREICFRIGFASLPRIGIVLSVVLVMVQLGLYFGFGRLVTTMIDHASTDLWIVSSGAKCFEDLSLLSTNMRDDLRTVDGVAEVTPVVVGFSAWRKPDGAMTPVLTGAGAALFAGALLSVIVGTAIVAQTLYSSTKEHLYEFATLRAIGASNSYIYRVIISQALLNAFIGFGIAGLDWTRRGPLHRERCPADCDHAQFDDRTVPSYRHYVHRFSDRRDCPRRPRNRAHAMTGSIIEAAWSLGSRIE